MAMNQRWGDQGFFDQFLRPIHIVHDALEQPCTLLHTSLNFQPAFGCHDQREEVKRPRPLGAVMIGVDVIGDTVIAHLVGKLFGPAIQVSQTRGTELVKESHPVWRQGKGTLLRRRLLAAQLVKVQRGRWQRESAHCIGQW